MEAINLGAGSGKLEQALTLAMDDAGVCSARHRVPPRFTTPHRHHFIPRYPSLHHTHRTTPHAPRAVTLSFKVTASCMWGGVGWSGGQGWAGSTEWRGVVVGGVWRHRSEWHLPKSFTRERVCAERAIEPGRAMTIYTVTDPVRLLNRPLCRAQLHLRHPPSLPPPTPPLSALPSLVSPLSHRLPPSPTVFQARSRAS